METEKWFDIDEAPMFEISSNKRIRKKEVRRESILRYYDTEGNLLDEVTKVSNKKPKLLTIDYTQRNKPRVTYWKEGKQMGRSVNKLYSKYVLKQDVTPKANRNRVERKLKF